MSSLSTLRGRVLYAVATDRMRRWGYAVTLGRAELGEYVRGQAESRTVGADADIALAGVAEWLRSDEAAEVAARARVAQESEGGDEWNDPPIWQPTEFDKATFRDDYIAAARPVLAALADLISPPRSADTGTAGDAVEPPSAPAPVAGPTPPDGPATT